MLFKSPEFELFFFRALFGASVGYAVVALLVLQPTNPVGFLSCVWAIVCLFGSWRGLKAAAARVSAHGRRDEPAE